MRLENLLQSSYWLAPPTSDLGWPLSAVLLLLGLAGLWLAQRRRKPALALAAALLLLPLAGRALGVSLFAVRAWWLAALAIVLMIIARAAWPRMLAALGHLRRGIHLILQQLQRAWRSRLLGSAATGMACVLAMAAVAAVIFWNVMLANVIGTRGVTGSDPYAYAQMGVDLVRRGTVFHEFPLVRVTYDMQIESAPVVHLGYLLPQDVRRISPTVWPPGYAVFTGLAYLFAGEAGLYWITPLFACLATLVITWLAFLIAPKAWGSGPRLLLAAASVALTATSYQQIEWQMVPMADIAAQVFSLLAVACAMCALRAPLGRDLGWAIAAGASLGIAFDVRYTQVLLAPALALAMWDPASRKRSFNRLLCTAAAALLCVLPIFFYHQQAFGNPFKPGSEEGQHFALANIWPVIQRFGADLSLSNEFGLVWPWVGLGALLMAWRAPRMLAVFGLYMLPVTLLHMAYAYFRPRDLLSIFPVGYLLAAFGALGLIMLLPFRSWRLAAMLCVYLLVREPYWQRSEKVINMPTTRAFATFGYLYSVQRDALDQIKSATPTNAAIGTSLNGGALDLHAQRLAFRPGYWNPVNAATFVGTLLAEGTPVYVLDDGVEMNDVLPHLRDIFILHEIGRYELPYYEFRGGGSTPKSVPMYQLSRNTQ